MKKISLLLISILLVFSISACSPATETKQETSAADASTESSTPAEESSKAEQSSAESSEAESTTAESKAKKDGDFEAFSVVTLDDIEVTYDHRPEKVVSFNLHTTENLLALGLGDKMVGRSYDNAVVLDKFKAEYDKIPAIAEKYPSLEVLLGANPDFVYGRSSAFNGKNAVADVNTFVDNGIMPYVSKATYTSGATMEDTYKDFEVLGKLFGVEDKANEIITAMKDQIAAVEEKVKKADKRLKVFVYDAKTETAFTCGRSLESDIIAKAGGDNVFGHIDKTWVEVSWEEVVEANPDVIVINDYGDTTAEEKIAFLKENAALADVAAVKNDKFVVLPLPSVFTGIRNGDAIVYLAENFYPDLVQ